VTKTRSEGVFMIHPLIKHWKLKGRILDETEACMFVVDLAMTELFLDNLVCCGIIVAMPNPQCSLRERPPSVAVQMQEELRLVI
jgi:hypothetical protein